MGCHYAGEFGVVYKGVLTNWNNVPMQGVAVKTLKGDIIIITVQFDYTCTIIITCPEIFLADHKQRYIMRNITFLLTQFIIVHAPCRSVLVVGCSEHGV